MNAINWADAMLRYAEDRLMTGAELAALFAGIGIQPSERPEPTQIVEALSIDCIPLAAARLASKADGTRAEVDWIFDALQLMDSVKDHHLLNEGEPLPLLLRKAAVGLGLAADVATGLIRHRMMESLVPIVNPPVTVEELHAAGGYDAEGNPIGRPDGGD